MAITKRPPYTIYLGGGPVGPGGQGGYNLDNQHTALGSITPGMLIETANTTDNESVGWQAHATSDGRHQSAFALEQFCYPDKTVDSPYGADDLVQAAYMTRGAAVWALIASGQDVTAGDEMSSAGDGTLHKGTTNVVARALESVNATSLSRIRVEVV